MKMLLSMQIVMKSLLWYNRDNKCRTLTYIYFPNHPIPSIWFHPEGIVGNIILPWGDRSPLPSPPGRDSSSTKFTPKVSYRRWDKIEEYRSGTTIAKGKAIGLFQPQPFSAQEAEEISFWMNRQRDLNPFSHLTALPLRYRLGVEVISPFGGR